jgi:membrane-associated phospholipid phosphatase
MSTSLYTHLCSSQVDYARTFCLDASGTSRSVCALGSYRNNLHRSTESLLIQHRDINQILDGRKSFPSGHSSTAFVGMTFVTLFLAGKTAALCFGITPPCGPFLRSRFARLCLVLSPLAFATWVAITRVEDYVGRSQAASWC